MFQNLEAYHPLDNMNGFCRLCLTDGCPLQDVFSCNLRKQPGHFTLKEKIFESTSIQIVEGDELPSQVCYECCEQVEKMYKFKQKCLAADVFLRKRTRLRSKIKEEPCKMTTTSDPIIVEDAIPSCTQTNGKLEVAKRKNRASYNGSCRREQKTEFDGLLKVEIKEELGEISDISIDTLSKSEGSQIEGFKKSSKNVRYKIPHKVTKFSCNLCGKKFASKWGLSRHKWSHSKITMVCKYCKKAFTNSESWLRHERTHEVGNRYKCTMCDKSYVSSTSHAAHVRKHTGERPFKCSDCSETFYLLSSFERHVAKHRGVKEYNCEICNALFWVPADLRAHVNRLH